MREDKRVRTRTCDQCGHITSDNGNFSYGASIWVGWIQLITTTNYKVRPMDAHKHVVPTNEECKDFCSRKCAIAYLGDKEEGFW